MQSLTAVPLTLDLCRLDRGLGPLLAGRPDLVLAADVDGANPDIDTPADLIAAAEGLP